MWYSGSTVVTYNGLMFSIIACVHVRWAVVFTDDIRQRCAMMSQRAQSELIYDEFLSMQSECVRSFSAHIAYHHRKHDELSIWNLVDIVVGWDKNLLRFRCIIAKLVERRKHRDSCGFVLFGQMSCESSRIYINQRTQKMCVFVIEHYVVCLLWKMGSKYHEHHNGSTSTRRASKHNTNETTQMR